MRRMGLWLVLVLVLGGLLALPLGCSPDEEGDGPATPAAGEVATVKMDLSWNGVEVSRLHLELTPQGVAGAQPTSLDVNDPGLQGTDFSVEIELLAGSWRLDVTAYDGADVVATGSVIFDAVPGSITPVTLTLDPGGERGDNELAGVDVTVRMCPASPVVSVITYQEWREPAPGERMELYLVINATLVPGVVPGAVDALVRWGAAEDQTAEVPLQPSERDAELWVGVFDLVDASAKHGVQIRIDGMQVCDDDEHGGIDPQWNPIMSVWVDDAERSCVLRLDGRPYCWGDCSGSVCDAPEGVRFEKLYVGEDVTCGLTDEGELSCWGDNEHGLLAPPGGRYLDFDVSDGTGCALGADSRNYHCWGRLAAIGGNSLLTGPGDWVVDAGHSIRVGGLPLYSEWFAGWVDWRWVCVVRFPHNRNPYCFGAGLPTADDGLGEPEDFVIKPDDEDAVSVSQVAMGWNHACWLDAGNVRCFGWGAEASDAPDGDDHTQVACAGTYCCGLREGNRFHCWGRDSEDNGVLEPPFDGAIQLAVGATHACALRSDHSVACWGRNHQGQAPHEPRF